MKETVLAAPPSITDIRSQYAYLKTIFSERNGEYEILRGIFDGTLAQDQKDKAAPGKLTRNRTEMIYNVLNAAIRRYMDQMSAPPRIEGIPRGFEIGDIELADKRAKLLTEIWDCNNMTVKLMQASFYQALLDKAVFNVRPAPHLPHKVKIELAVPDFYFPICDGDDWSNPRAVIYGFRKFNDQTFRDPMRFRQESAMDTVIEYWDKTWFIRIDGDQALMIKHNLGEVLWYEAQNIPIPHRHRGQGDIDQAINLQEYLNLLLSSFADMIAYAANPIAVVRGTKVGGTNLPFQERAVWELERDAQVGFLQWTGAPPTTEAQTLRVFQGIEDLTGVSSPAFGREIPSGTSGNAIRSLLAGFNTRLGTKQQLMGDCMVRINRGVQLVLENLFPEEEFEINGENIKPGAELGKPQRYTVKPSEFKGWYKTRVVFSPLDPASMYFQEMDKFAKGVQSRYTTMKNLGIVSVWDELERIRIEKREEADQANDMALAQQGQFVSPEKQAAATADNQQAMTELFHQLKGQTASGGGIPGANPNGQDQRDRVKATAAAAALPPPPSGVAAPTGPSMPSSLANPEVTIEDLMQKLRGAPLSGKAAVSGPVVTAGKGAATIHLENPQDAGEIRRILGPVAQGVVFQGLDPNRPTGADYIDLRGSQKKNQVEPRKIQGYLNVIVVGIVPTNNALVYEIAVQGKKDTVPLGKTNPQRAVNAEQGELIKVRVEGITRREDNGVVKYSLVSPMPVKSEGLAAPSSLDDVQKLWEKGK